MESLQEYKTQKRNGSVGQETRERLKSPACDIVDKKDRFLIFLDVPGTKEESIEINYEKNVLSVRAVTEAFSFDGLSLLHSEYYPGQLTWTRKFSLSDVIDSERIEALLKDGVLRIDLPKREETKPRKIELKH